MMRSPWNENLRGMKRFSWIAVQRTSRDGSRNQKKGETTKDSKDTKRNAQKETSHRHSLHFFVPHLFAFSIRGLTNSRATLSAFPTTIGSWTIQKDEKRRRRFFNRTAAFSAGSGDPAGPRTFTRFFFKLHERSCIGSARRVDTGSGFIRILEGDRRCNAI